MDIPESYAYIVPSSLGRMSIVLISGLIWTWYLPFLSASQDSLPPWMMTLYS